MDEEAGVRPVSISVENDAELLRKVEIYLLEKSLIPTLKETVTTLGVITED